jgi:hypothetical protein
VAEQQIRLVRYVTLLAFAAIAIRGIDGLCADTREEVMRDAVYAAAKAKESAHEANSVAKKIRTTLKSHRKIYTSSTGELTIAEGDFGIGIHETQKGEWKLDRYEGELQSGLWSGYGVYYANAGIHAERMVASGLKGWYPGARYEGQWEQGRQHGYGIVYGATGERYEGQFRGGYAHGYGILYFNSGEIHYGYVEQRAEGHWRSWIDPQRHVSEGGSSENIVALKEVPNDDVSEKWDSLEIAQSQCRELGIKPGTENFGQCVLRLMDSGTGSATAEIDTGPLVAKADVPVAKLGERLALVIGNASYSDAPLDNPLNDSDLMSEVLREVGFSVTLVQDVSQIEMKQTIVEFGIQLEDSGPDAVGLFYFAGHGVQVRGSNYLIPVGTPYIGRAADVDVFAVDANEVLDQMYFAANAMNIVILDACRNNPYYRRFRGTPVRGLARMDAPRGTIIAYSTRPGDLASDGTGDYSPYTEALVHAMRIPGLSLHDVFIQTRVAVMEATQQQQVPWEEGGLTANFYFQPIANSSAEIN